MTDLMPHEDLVRIEGGVPWFRVIGSVALAACAIWTVQRSFEPAGAPVVVFETVLGPGFSIEVPGDLIVVDDETVLDELSNDIQGRALLIATDGPNAASGTRVLVARTDLPFPARDELAERPWSLPGPVIAAESDGRAAYRIDSELAEERAASAVMVVDGMRFRWLVLVIVGPEERQTSGDDVDRVLRSFDLAQWA